MARKIYLVLVEYEPSYVRTSKQFTEKYWISDEQLRDQVGFFFDKIAAEKYASYLATKYKGTDVSIFEQTTTFYANVLPTKKKWVNDTLIPDEVAE